MYHKHRFNTRSWVFAILNLAAILALHPCRAGELGNLLNGVKTAGPVFPAAENETAAIACRWTVEAKVSRTAVPAPGNREARVEIITTKPLQLGQNPLLASGTKLTATLALEGTRVSATASEWAGSTPAAKGTVPLTVVATVQRADAEQVPLEVNAPAGTPVLFKIGTVTALKAPEPVKSAPNGPKKTARR